MMEHKENQQRLEAARKIDDQLSLLVENIDILSSVTPLMGCEEAQRERFLLIIAFPLNPALPTKIKRLMFIKLSEIFTLFPLKTSTA
ncbi:hypothetical protein K6U70_14985 [Vibrio vulnificus]|nr:hypothetical protein [Vibrio vulnificus]